MSPRWYAFSQLRPQLPLNSVWAIQASKPCQTLSPMLSNPHVSKTRREKVIPKGVDCRDGVDCVIDRLDQALQSPLAVGSVIKNAATASVGSISKRRRTMR